VRKAARRLGHPLLSGYPIPLPYKSLILIEAGYTPHPVCHFPFVFMNLEYGGMSKSMAAKGLSIKVSL
jgi:hypothetical protein